MGFVELVKEYNSVCIILIIMEIAETVKQKSLKKLLQLEKEDLLQYIYNLSIIIEKSDYLAEIKYSSAFLIQKSLTLTGVN